MLHWAWTAYLRGIWQSFSVVKSVENDLVPAHTHAHIHTLPFDLEKGLYSGASQKSLRLKEVNILNDHPKYLSIF